MHVRLLPRALQFLLNDRRIKAVDWRHVTISRAIAREFSVTCSRCRRRAAREPVALAMLASIEVGTFSIGVCPGCGIGYWTEVSPEKKSRR